MNRLARLRRLVLWSVCLYAIAVPAAGPDADPLFRAALRGDALAQLNLGAALDHGLAGREADPSRAVLWYRRAAEQGLAAAQFNLAHCLATGRGVAQSYPQALPWMRRAAEQGLADAQFLLGVMLSEGLGGSVERQAARQWLEAAAARGQTDARDYLRRQYEKPH